MEIVCTGARVAGKTLHGMGIDTRRPACAALVRKDNAVVFNGFSKPRDRICAVRTGTCTARASLQEKEKRHVIMRTPSCTHCPVKQFQPAACTAWDTGTVRSDAVRTAPV